MDDPDRPAGPTWVTVLTHWALVEADLHDRYGFDTGAPGALERRTWTWLQNRITGLLHPIAVRETRLGIALYPPRPEEVIGRGPRPW